MRDRGVALLAAWTATGAVVLVCWLSGAAGGANGCSSPAGPAACARLTSAPFVSASQARQAMTALWNARERADAARNVNALDQIDTGTELLGDHYALDSLICGCSTWYWTKGTRRIESLNLFLPRQAHYPLFFMAGVLAAPKGETEPAGTATAYMLATRAAPDSPWRIAMQIFDVGYQSPPPAIASPAVDPAGYDLAASPSELKAAAKWPSMLAAYYQHIKNAGVPPAQSPFLPGIQTTGTDLALNREGSVSDGILHRYEFVAAPSGGPWVFEENGSLMSCADINEYSTTTWARPNTVFQQIDGTKPNWGPDLNSGFYSKIVTTFERAVCVVHTPAGLVVWGANSTSGYPIHDGGVPANAGPGTTRVL